MNEKHFWLFGNLSPDIRGNNRVKHQLCAARCLVQFPSFHKDWSVNLADGRLD